MLTDNDITDGLADYFGWLDDRQGDISTAEITASTRKALSTRHRPHHRARRLVLALSGALIAATIGAIAVVNGLDGDRSDNEVPLISAGHESTEPDQDLSGSPVASTVVAAAPSVPTSNTATESDTPMPTGELTIADVRDAQMDALRNLPGFSATVSRTTDNGDGTAVVETTSFAVLADGSFYTEDSAGSFNSYDPATGINLSGPINPSEDSTYQRMLGQADNSLPFGILVGYDPTQIVAESQGDGWRQDIQVVDLNGKPAWQVTTTYTFVKAPDFTMIGGGEPPPDFTQITTETIDPDTGLIVAYSSSSTRENTPPVDARLSDIQVITTMPAGFPGQVPPGATVNESGNPDGFHRVDTNDVLGRFGIPTPIPALAEQATISIAETPTYDESADSRTSDPAGTIIEATFSTSKGFVETSVIITTQSILEGHAPPAGSTNVDEFLCTDADTDLQCDSADANLKQHPEEATGHDVITIAEGPLAGQVAVFDGRWLTTDLHPFRIRIQADNNLAAAVDIANTIKLESST